MLSPYTSRGCVRVEPLERRTLLDAIPIGAEFRVNTHTPAWQADPAVAVEADGDLIVTWYSYGQDGDGRGVYARQFDAAGAPKGEEFLVNTHTTGYQTNPAVAVDDDGDFVIVWQSENQDGSGWGVYGQRFDATGAPQGGEFQVNVTFTAGNQQHPAVAMDADGAFVVAWENHSSPGVGLYAKRYDENGVALGDEFLVNTVSTQSNPAIAMNDGGAFVIAWTGLGSQSDVFYRQYDNAGAPLGIATRANTYTSSVQAYPSVAISAAGDFVIAWESNTQDEPASLGVYAQRFNAAGAAQGPEFRVNTMTVDHQHTAAVAMDDDGNFVVTWTSAEQDGTAYGIYAQRYTAAGATVGDEFRVNAHTPNVQQYPSVAADADGDFFVAWESFGQDGSGFGVYAQRFDVAVSVGDSAFHFATAPHELRFTFNTDVSASLGSEDLVVENLTSGQTIPSTDFTVTYDANTNVATFTYTGPDGALPDGSYRATLLASGISGPGGLTLRSDHVFEFFFLRGDANRDRIVNLRDFNILAANFGQSGPGVDFTKADFNYDGQVNLQDFNLLASRFGQSVAPTTSARAGGSLFGGYRIGGEERSDESDELLR